MLPSCFFIFISTTGLFAKYLFDRFSVRSIAIVGGILFCSGSVMMVFVSSLNGLLLAYGVLQGRISNKVEFNLFNRALGEQESVSDWPRQPCTLHSSSIL